MTLTLVQFCSPAKNSISHTDNATVWHDRTFYIFNQLRTNLPDLAILHDHPEPQLMKRHFAAITDGSADVNPNLFGMSWERYQMADFSTPVAVSEIGIISRKLIERSVFEGIFDTMSLIMIVVTIIALWLSLLAAIKM